MLTKNEYKAVLRTDLTSFIQRSFYELNPSTELKMAPYIEAIAAALEDCRLGKRKRLAIDLPPRYLKSHCASVAFVAWLLGHNSSLHVINASYGQELSDKLARDCRTLMTSPFYKELFPTRLSDRQAVHDFSTTDNGTRMATSVGGVLTGRGADVIILDDPLKPDEALSETQRNGVNEWYEHTLLSRLNDKENGVIIIIMQRLHQDDLVGHVLEQGGWEVLSLPAIAEQDESILIETPLGSYRYERKAGDPLHPERESLEALERIRKVVGEYHFASQYQQNPMPLGGALVKTKWLQYYEPDELSTPFESIVQSWDTANKAGELNDYSVCTTWGVRNKCFFLLNVLRRKMEYPDLKRAVRDQAYLYSPNSILIEDKASGTQLIQELISEGMHRVARYEPPTGTDKIMRLHSQTATIENEFVFLPKEAPWLADYIKELTGFPGCKYDDQVDSTTQFLDWIKQPFPHAGLLEFLKLKVEEAGKHKPPAKSLYEIAQEQGARITHIGW